MSKIYKNKIFVLVVLILFVGSSFAFALVNVFPEEKKASYVFDTPLSNQDEAVFLQQNKVVMKFFYSPTCPICENMDPVVDELVNEFGGSLIVEKISVVDYADFATQMDVERVPFFHIKGKTVDTYTGEIDKEELFTKICNLYFEEIDVCL